MASIQEPVKRRVVADLDRLITESVWIKILDKEYEMKPISTESFFKFIQGVENLNRLDKSVLKIEPLVECYYDIIRPIVPEFPMEDIYKLTQPQVAALIQLVVDHTKGGNYVEGKFQRLQEIVSPSKLVN